MFKTIHKILIRLDEKIGQGFLRSMPTDIWSLFFTIWLRFVGAKINKGSRIHRKVYVRHPENIKLGKNIKIPASTDMAGMGPICIDDDTLVGASVRFITNHHPLDDDSLTKKEQIQGTQKNIKVGKNCWIMNNVILIAGKEGLNIGDNVWIAAGSIVTKNIESNTFVGGIPAKEIRKII